MSIRSFKKIIFLSFVCIFPFAANSATEEAIAEKHIRVAMRMIGHEVLLCLGDDESRVMPIEKIDQHYKIPFESEFSFDPSNIISTINQVMLDAEISNRYVVEIEQCDTKEIVHTFEIGNPNHMDIIPCGGRILPKACYSLLITVVDDRLAPTSISSSTGLGNSSPIKSAFLIVPLLILLGLVGFLVKKKNPVDTDPNLVKIGASQFDKKNMRLFFDDKSVELSNKEAELLSVLHASVNTPIERELILQKVWGDEGDYIGRTLDVFISKLRKKLHADASVKIVNIRGVGYKLVVNTLK